MDQSPLLSVIVPVYRVEAYLPRCIDSILGQTYRNLEIYLVDDGSPDRCPEICSRYAEKDSRIRVIHQENQGQAIARNRALDVCRGTYVTFADSDDWLEPDAYEAMMETALRTGAKLVCAGRYNNYEDGRQEIGLCPSENQILSKEEMLKKLFTWQECDSAPWDKLYHRSLFRQLRFPEESSYEDVGLVYRLIIEAGDTAMLAKPVYHYLQRSGSTSYGQVNPKMFRFPKQTGILYDYICREVPEVRNEARYLRARSLAVCVVLLDQADREQREKYAQQLKSCRKDLRSHFFFIASSPCFDSRERVRDLLMALNLYRCTRKFFTREQQENANEKSE